MSVPTLGVTVETLIRPEPAEHLRLGRAGEELAVGHVRSLGLVVLSRNWRCRDGELDLVATDGAQLIVFEVKTRSGDGFGQPAEAVTPEKQARIRRCAHRWLREFRVGWCPIRFDVIAIVWPAGARPRLRHLPEAF